MKKSNWFYSPKTQIIMYALLLVFTPFLMLRNYLQSAIGKLSRFSYHIGEWEIPYLLSAIVLLLIIVVLLNFRKILLRHILAGSVCVLLIYIAPLFTDYYFDHRFYDLQHNWHYFAYGIYAFIAFRYFKSRKLPIEKIVLFIYWISVSIFWSVYRRDQRFQVQDPA